MRDEVKMLDINRLDARIDELVTTIFEMEKRIEALEAAQAVAAVVRGEEN